MAKTYAPGQAKERQTPFGPVVRWGVKADDLIAFVKQHANDRGYINLEIVPRKEQGRFGETHSIVLDDYVPQTGAGARQDDARRNGPARESKPSWERGDGYNEVGGFEQSPFDTDPF